MSSGTRHTFKQELIIRITRMFHKSSLPAIPASCLRDMSTSSLAAFEEWVQPLIQNNPQVTPATHQLTGGSRGKKRHADKEE